MNPKVYLAPMSGVTDLSFRLISRSLGASHCFFEMLDSKATLYSHPKNRRLLRTHKKDSPISAQLLGADPSVMLEAAQTILGLTSISSLDINSACPARKVLKKRSGAALLEDAPRLGKIIHKLVSNLQIPITVKLRVGLNNRDLKSCVRTARICQENGASTVFIHGRTREQGYSGDVDYEAIKAVKDALEIPVFGSGNIFNPPMAKEMLDKTGCDGILVARGALGNPWIFRDIEGYLKSGTIPKPPTLAQKKRVLKRHLAYINKYKEISPACKMGFMGKIAMWYLKGFSHATILRQEICRARSYRELLRLINRTS